MANRTSKKLPPIIVERLAAYKKDQNVPLPNLAKETGLTVKFLQSYFEKLGGFDEHETPMPPQPANPPVAPAELARNMFARQYGPDGKPLATVMTGAASEQIEAVINRNAPKSSDRLEKNIFRGNKPPEKSRNPYDDRRF